LNTISRDEVRGEWRKLHNEELNDLYSSPTTARDEIERNELGGTYTAYGGRERFVQSFGAKS
jgi:hypothetical protein